MDQPCDPRFGLHTVAQQAKTRLAHVPSTRQVFIQQCSVCGEHLNEFSLSGGVAIGTNAHVLKLPGEALVIQASSDWVALILEHGDSLSDEALDDVLCRPWGYYREHETGVDMSRHPLGAQPEAGGGLMTASERNRDREIARRHNRERQPLLQGTSEDQTVRLALIHRFRSSTTDAMLSACNRCSRVLVNDDNTVMLESAQKCPYCDCRFPKCFLPQEDPEHPKHFLCEDHRARREEGLAANDQAARKLLLESPASFYQPEPRSTTLRPNPSTSTGTPGTPRSAPTPGPRNSSRSSPETNGLLHPCVEVRVPQPSLQAALQQLEEAWQPPFDDKLYTLEPNAVEATTMYLRALELVAPRYWRPVLNQRVETAAKRQNREGS